MFHVEHLQGKCSTWNIRLNIDFLMACGYKKAMAHIISITNQKGGVGKTTSSISLSTALAKSGVDVLLIDADSQFNTTSGLNAQNNRTFYDFLWSEGPDFSSYVQATKYPTLSLIGADPRLSGLEFEWSGLDQNKHILKRKMELIEKNYDFIFIDCPPSLGLLTVNALVASKFFIVPLQCEYYALEGLSLLLNTACTIKENLNPDLTLQGILLTMFDSRNTLSHKVVEQVRLHFKNKVFQTVIPRNVRLSEAPSHGIPISDYAPDSSGALAYNKLAEELIERLNFKKAFKENVLQ